MKTFEKGYHGKNINCREKNECRDPEFCDDSSLCLNTPGYAYCVPKTDTECPSGSQSKIVVGNLGLKIWKHVWSKIKILNKKNKDFCTPFTPN